jgi:hypothetical protein
VFVADNARGVDILTFGGGRSAKTVVAPPLRTAPQIRFEPSPLWGNLCPVAPGV